MSVVNGNVIYTVDESSFEAIGRVIDTFLPRKREDDKLHTPYQDVTNGRIGGVDFIETDEFKQVQKELESLKMMFSGHNSGKRSKLPLLDGKSMDSQTKEVKASQFDQLLNVTPVLLGFLEDRMKAMLTEAPSLEQRWVHHVYMHTVACIREFCSFGPTSIQDRMPAERYFPLEDVGPLYEASDDLIKFLSDYRDACQQSAESAGKRFRDSIAMRCGAESVNDLINQWKTWQSDYFWFAPTPEVTAETKKCLDIVKGVLEAQNNNSSDFPEYEDCRTRTLARLESLLSKLSAFEEEAEPSKTVTLICGQDEAQ